ncbi:hypothetical protein [Aeromonas sp. R5-2]|uniref:hypothetical protein n=1 Tax=Aeromonas sp. R5-2 TaxID=3138468 RepID=UPI0034A5558A
MPFRQQFERFIRLIAEDFVEGFDLEFDCHIVLFLGRRLAWQTVEREPITFNTKQFHAQAKEPIEANLEGLNLSH